MLELSIVRDLVTIFGVVAGFSYYVVIVRNAQKVRKYQTLKELAQEFSSGESYNTFFRLLDAKWDNVDDFYRKYSLDSERDFTINRFRLFMSLNIYGMMLRDGILHRSDVYDAAGRGFIDLWEKYAKIIYSDRERLYNGDPSYLGAFEYLINELVEERKQRGVNW